MNVLIINGHPLRNSFNEALADAYIKGLHSTTAEIKILNIREINLSLDVSENSNDANINKQITDAQNLITWSTHQVWFYPLWWADVPALVKAFFEQVFVSGFAFKYQKSDKFVKWDKFLNGKTAHIITTMDSPPWFYKYFVKDPAFKMLKYNLKFCGFKKVKRHYFGSVKLSVSEQRKKWLTQAEKMGRLIK
jgi:putative NADPH-quinone reductase